MNDHKYNRDRDGAQVEPIRKMRSVEATRAVWQTSAELTGSELLVLQAMASHADADFNCYPSLDRLAQMTRLSRRQVIRVVHGLREKHLIAFDDNLGGQRRCNRYHLLITTNGDMNGDIKGDIVNSDTPKNGDISNSERVTNSHVNGDILSANGDIAMSPEGVKGFESFLKEWGKTEPVFFRNYDQTRQELESNPGDFLKKLLAEGTPITRDDVCDGHGPFVRSGWRWGNWVAMAGHRSIYSGRFGHDAGCAGCRATFDTTSPQRPTIVRQFDLRSPAICAIHGKFIFRASLTENTPDYEKRGLRFAVYSDECPGCDSDWTERCYLQDELGLSDDEWERGGERIVKAVAFARGEGEVQ